MVNMKKIIIAVIVLVFSLSSNLCLAGEVDIFLFGFSYHADRKGTYRQAPLKLDSKGLWVFDPGIGLGYDFRKSIKKEGFSPVVMAGFFQNTSNKLFSFGDAGLRYRKFMTGKIFWEVNVLGMLCRAKSWDDDSYAFAGLPYADIGIGYDFGKSLVSFSLTYLPKSNRFGIGISRDTDIFFMGMKVSF